jgi:hypothetical protein
MSPEQRRAALYLIPALYGVALVIGIFAHAFVPIAVIGALVTSVLYGAVARASAGPGRGRNRNRNRNRNRG